jgi:hypothetical protein
MTAPEASERAGDRESDEQGRGAARRVAELTSGLQAPNNEVDAGSVPPTTGVARPPSLARQLKPLRSEGGEKDPTSLKGARSNRRRSNLMPHTAHSHAHISSHSSVRSGGRVHMAAEVTPAACAVVREGQAG